MRKQGVYLEHNKFFTHLNEKLKTVMAKLVYLDFKDLVIDTIEEMG